MAFFLKEFIDIEVKKEGMSIKQISEITGLDKEKIEKL